MTLKVNIKFIIIAIFDVFYTKIPILGILENRFINKYGSIGLKGEEA